MFFWTMSLDNFSQLVTSKNYTILNKHKIRLITMCCTVVYKKSDLTSVDLKSQTRQVHLWKINQGVWSCGFDCKGLQWVTLPLLVKFLQTAFQAWKTENKTSKLNISMKLKLHITFLNIRIHFNFNLAFVAFVLTSS